MQASHKMKRQAVKYEGGNLKLVSDKTLALKENQVLIKVAYAPVTNYDKACLRLKSELERKECEGMLFGSEGSGIIEEVGPGVDSNLKGKKCAFCHGGWSQFIVQDLDKVILLDDSVDLKMCATAVINPLTALCVKYIMLDR
jgi:NADPH:quinone reductase-like Zn-dependent oxidoreductase